METSRENRQIAEVVIAGGGTRVETGTKVAPDLRPGGRVFYGKYGKDILDGEEVLLLREDDIGGVRV